MMNRGHLRVIFATSTIAAGVNFPARTIVLLNSDLFNGNDFSPLSATEFSQMTGRAGRRGQDNIGFMLTIAGKFMDLNHIRRLLFQKPEDILSQLKNDFGMVLNLLLSQTPEDIRKIFERSLAAYQQNIRHHGAAFSAAKSLWADFSRHLKFLQKEEFVDESGALTDDGHWASKLRLDYPLLVAQCLRENAFPEENEKILAAVVAFFTYDRDDDLKLTIKDLPPKLLLSFKKVVLAVQASYPPFWKRRALPPRNFTHRRVLPFIIGRRGTVGILSSRPRESRKVIWRRWFCVQADNLRQIASLKDTHPGIAECAYRARDAILREPVLFL